MSSEPRPPTFLETVYDPDLSSLFLRGLLASEDQVKAQTFLFLKRSLLFSHFRRPSRELADEAQRLFFCYICDAATCPIKLDAEIYDRVSHRIYDPSRSHKVDNTFFAEVNDECEKALRPDFEEFIKRNVWKQVSSFDKIAQPTVPTVARHRGLRASFQTFMDKHSLEPSMAVSSLTIPDEVDDGEDGEDGDKKKKDKKDKKKKEGDEEGEHLVKSEEIAPGLYSLTSGLWDFVVKAEKLRENGELEGTHGSSSTGTGGHGDTSFSSSSKGNTTSSSGDGKSSSSSSDSDNAKRLYKKFKKLLPVTFSGDGSLSAFLLTTLDNAIMSIRQSSTFLSWIEAGEWKNIDFTPNISQSIQKDGNMELPTLAAALTGPLERICGMYFTESTVPLQFLKEVMGYMLLFNDSAAAANKKTIKTSAKSIYQRYFVDQATNLKFPKEISEEIKASVGGLSSSKMTQHLFQRAGSWIYYRGSSTWFRDFQASLLWTVKEYNNHSAQALAVTEEFTRECLSGVSLDLEPSIDDVIINPRLLQSFCEYLPQADGASFVSFLTRSTSIHSSGKTYLGREEAESVINLLSTCIRADIPPIAGLYRISRTLLDSSKSSSQAMSTCPFDVATSIIMVHLASQYLENWIEDCQGDFEGIPWEPAGFVRCNSRIHDQLIARAKSDEFAASLATDRAGSGSETFLSEGSGATESEDGGLSVSSDPDEKGKKGGKNAGKKGAIGDSNPVLPDGSQPGNEADSSVALSQSSIASVAPRIPKIEQTLQSTLLRQLFEEQVLQTSISEEELSAWRAFCAFYAKFMGFKDDQFKEAQEVMRKEAQELFDKHWKLMRNSDYIRSRLSKAEDPITPCFFFEEESKMFAAYHSKFEGVLRHAGWKPQN